MYQNLRAMTKIFTLRNILTLLLFFIFFTSCEEREDALQSISSEDSIKEDKVIQTIKDEKTGKVVYFISKN